MGALSAEKGSYQFELPQSRHLTIVYMYMYMCICWKRALSCFLGSSLCLISLCTAVLCHAPICPLHLSFDPYFVPDICSLDPCFCPSTSFLDPYLAACLLLVLGYYVKLQILDVAFPLEVEIISANHSSKKREENVCIGALATRKSQPQRSNNLAWPMPCTRPQRVGNSAACYFRHVSPTT